MSETLSTPRADLSRYAPRLEVIHINPDKIRLVIGPGGEMIRKLIAESGVDAIDIEDDGSVTIASPDGIKLQRAREMISALTEDVELGKVYQGIVKKVVDFGAFVEVFPGTEGLLHISEMDRQRVAQVTDVVNEGDRIEVKCIEIDDTTGKIRLSHKAVLFDQDRANGIEVPEQAERPPRERFDRDRGPRRGPPRR
jgi:polyribonucleotide nucleotidyltransferase